MALYQQLESLSHARHGDLKVRPASDYGFARDCLALPIGMHELAQVAREYAIVFPEHATLPVALMGLQAGGNAYVSVEGAWLADYVPDGIRFYPFAVKTAKPAKPSAAGRDDAAGGESPADKQSGRIAPMLDAGSVLVSAGEGEPIFTGDKAISPAMAERMEGLRRFARSAEAARAAMAAIEAADILVERKVRIVDAGAKPQVVQGLRAIDEARFNSLPAKSFTALRKAGALPLVYAHLISWANFKQGRIGRSHPRSDGQSGT